MDFSNHHLLKHFERKTLVMGVVNVTPDSFSDGGRYSSVEAAVAHGRQLLADGADILDIGGESTRPGATPVSVEEELARVVPVIEGLKPYVPWISVDTRHADVMEAALNAGATIVNDVSGLSHDERSASVVARFGVPVILMHMQGSPVDMQKNPNYNNVMEDVLSWIKLRIAFCKTHRIAADMLVIDPGIGFGKSLEHNLLLLRNIKEFQGLGVPTLLGTSRKSFIEKIDEGVDVDQRLGGSLASALWGISQGVNIVRVHDVFETRQAIKIYEAISSAPPIGA